MKVICALCGGLEKEDDAIRMSQQDLDYFQGHRLRVPVVTSCHETFTVKSKSICMNCYKYFPLKKSNIKIKLSQEDKYELFEFIHAIDPTIIMDHHAIQKLFSKVDQIIYDILKDIR